MTVRRRKRKNKLHGQRTHGSGNTKNRRGAGSRGGRGRAGSQKHKFNLYAGEFGKDRKTVLPSKSSRAINLDMLVQLLPKWIEQKKAEKTGEGIVIDGKKIGFSKVLGKAQDLKERLILKNLTASKKAGEKIKAAGGSIESVEEEAVEEENEAAEGEEIKEEKPETDGEKKTEIKEGEEKKV